MLDKHQVYAALKSVLETRRLRIEDSLADSIKSMSSETKSSAGDKHETGRAMAQLEQEKLSSQLATAIKLSGIITGIDPGQKHNKIQFGSLVQIDENWFFFSVGIGSITLGPTDVFCLSAGTPLGSCLLGKSAGETISFNNKKMEIISLT